MTVTLESGQLDPEARPRILVVSPHGDDEVYGCGGLMARTASRGGAVEVVYLAVGGVKHRHLAEEATTDLRVAEIAKACSTLGVQRWSVLYPGMDMRLDTVPQLDMVSRLDRVIEDGRFDEVYFPYPSHNHDHQAVHRACSAALRPGAHAGIGLCAMYEYVYPGWCQVTAPGGRLYVDISEFIDRKCEALTAYASQLKQPPSPLSTSGVRTLAALRGMEACVGFAELFHVVQMLR